MMEQSWNQLRLIIPDEIEIFYSVKANPNIWIIDFIRRMGALSEVASSGELAVAVRAAVSPADIIFVGPGKSEYELEDAVTHDIRAIVAECAT